MDLISREELLKTFQVQNLLYRPNNLWNIVWIEELIKNAQSVEIPQWIPCSERLPDTDVQVLVTLGYTYESDYTMYSIARYIHFENGECHWCDNFYGYLEWDKYSDGRGGDSSRKVIAWCPLQPAYKGD